MQGKGESCTRDTLKTIDSYFCMVNFLVESVRQKLHNVSYLERSNNIRKLFNVRQKSKIIC